MRIWIDLSNSPHPLLFAPIARRLEALGCEVKVTARDNAQTVELARERWRDFEVIGGPSPAGRAAKAWSTLDRTRRLAAWARRERPDVALSHNSYGQITAARTLGIRTVTAMDYEHQPANHLAFRLAQTVLLPTVLGSICAPMGAAPRKTRYYDGLKEELYLGDFRPDPSTLAAVGLERAPDSVVVVARTPPSGALYHRAENPLFLEVLELVSREPRVRCIVLCRRPDQRRAIARLGLPNLLLPERALDARTLMRAADLVIGAGGTMTREAALLGVPTLSLFAGSTPAVDRWLEQRGALRRVSSLEELPPIRRRSCEPRDPGELRARGARLIDEFLEAVFETRWPRPAPATARANGGPARLAKAPARHEDAVELARRLERWGADRGWQGTDPYEGLNASRRLVAPLKTSLLGRRLLIQAVKRSPLDLRPLLGIRPEPSAAAVAWVVSAYARNGFLEPDEAHAKLRGALQLLGALRSPRYDEPCWGYHFDVQSRVFFYPRGEPNVIATAFAGLALLDAHAALGDPELLAEARRVGRFLIRHVPQTDAPPGAYFGYLPGDRSPIHNSNVLVASLLARLTAEGEDGEGFAEAATAAVRYTTARQHPNGSWSYGERPNLDWVDGFHTGYVLDGLRACADAGVARDLAEEAWMRGLDFYRRELFLEDGTPKYYATKTLPIDAQCVAQGIQTLAIAGRRDPGCAAAAWRTFGFAQRQMLGRRGLPLFQRRRLWTNRAVHVRWVIAPTLLALARLLALDQAAPRASRERVAGVAV